MYAKRILIVEDNHLLAAALSDLLEMNGFEIAGHLVQGEDVLPWLRRNEADLILMDIRLDGKMTGIETVQGIKGQSPLPVIFLTAQEDAATLEKVLALRPTGFITKPYKDTDLLAAVRLATAGPRETPTDEPGADLRGVLVGKDCLFLRAKKQYERVVFSEILYLQSDRMYTHVFLDRGPLVVAEPMGTVLDALPPTQFVRVHRSYAVNVSKVAAFDRENLQVSTYSLPLSASYRAAFLALLQG